MSKVQIEFTSDHQKVIQGLAKANAKLEQQVATLRKLDRTGKRASKSVRGIGTSAMGAVAGMYSLHNIIGKVNQGLQDQLRIRQESGRGIEESERQLKQFVQVADTPQRQRELKAIAMAITTKHGIPLQRARDITFAMESVELSDDQMMKIASFKKFITELAPVIESLAGLRKQFGEGMLGGTLRSQMGALIKGAQKSKVSVPAFGQDILGPAQQIQTLGGTAEEAFAAQAVLSLALKSKEEAATALARFAQVVERNRRFEGRGLTFAIETMAGMSKRQRKAIIGENVKAAQALVLLEPGNLADYRANLAAVSRAATTEDVVGQKMAMAAQDIELRRLSGFQIARESTKAIREGLYGPGELARGEFEQRVEGVYDAKVKSLRKEGGFLASTELVELHIERFFKRFEMLIERTFGLRAGTGVADFLSPAGMAFKLTGGDGPIAAEAQRQIDLLEKINDELVRQGKQGQSARIPVNTEPIE